MFAICTLHRSCEKCNLRFYERDQHSDARPRELLGLSEDGREGCVFRLPYDAFNQIDFPLLVFVNFYERRL